MAEIKTKIVVTHEILVEIELKPGVDAKLAAEFLRQEVAAQVERAEFAIRDTIIENEWTSKNVASYRFAQ